MFPSDDNVSLSVDLPAEHLKFFPVVRWLLDPHGERHRGRTRLMAVTWMAIALDHPGLEVKVWDHWNNAKGNEHLMAMLQVMIEHDPPFAAQWTLTKNSIQFNPKEPNPWKQ